jgi:hypothetical protein
MSRLVPRNFKNRILASLPKKEIDRLLPHLSPVKLKVRQPLLDGHGDHAYFLDEGLASVVLPMEDGSTVEVGVIGTPRTTVTLAAGMLHKAGLIDYTRGHVTIKNRAELEEAACECYGVVRKEFQRLGLS